MSSLLKYDWYITFIVNRSIVSGRVVIMIST